jgi:hypothetical protein
MPKKCWISQYIGFNNEGKRDWSVGTKRKVREVRDRFIKGSNNDQILILDISPLTVASRATYEGGDKDATTNSDRGNGGSGSQESGVERHDVIYVSDTINTIDNGKSRTSTRSENQMSSELL